MRTLTLQIEANGAVHSTQGGAFVLVESVSAGAIAITWLDEYGQERGTVRSASQARRYRPGFLFQGFRIEGTVGAVVVVTVGENEDADATTLDGVRVVNPAGDPVKTEIVNPITLSASAVDVRHNGANVTAANPLPVTFQGLEDPLGVREVLAAAPVDLAPVVAQAAQNTLLNDPAARAFLARNAGTAEIALYTTAGTTFANSTIRLLPGEVWLETRSPGAQWYVRRDPAGADGNVNIHVDK